MKSGGTPKMATVHKQHSSMIGRSKLWVAVAALYFAIGAIALRRVRSSRRDHTVFHRTTEESPSSRPMKVMQGMSPQIGSKVTNPYTTLLIDSLSDLATVEVFHWVRAMRADFDVIHLHWPELMIRGTGLRGVLKPLLFAIMLLRLRVARIPIVRTAHNLKPHEAGSRIESALLRRLDRQTSAWIVMNHATPTPDSDWTFYVPHGHYRDWYEAGHRETVPNSLLFFGAIRGYKGLDSLLQAIKNLPDETTLRIVGKPTDQSTRELIENFVSDSSRTTADLRFVTDAELSDEISGAERVILPYRDFHNSGAALLALSLNRQVIVPTTPATRELEQEFGKPWVLTYKGDLTAPNLASLLSTPAPSVGSHPDMSTRDWSLVAAKTYDVYVDAIRRVRAASR